MGFQVGDRVQVGDPLFPNTGTVTAVYEGIVAVRLKNGFVLPFTEDKLAPLTDREVLLRSVDTQTVTEAFSEADSDDAVIIVQHGDGLDETFIGVAVPAECLGDYDAEAEWIAAAGDWVWPFRSPVIVLHDPRHRFESGCSTNSHFDSGDSDLDPHADCEHALVASVIEEVKGKKKTDRDEINGSVCIDCLMAIANGDTSGIDDLLAWQLRVEMKNATDNGVYTVVPVGDTTYFSWSPCDYCASTLGGDRQDVVFIDNRRNK